MKWNRLITMLAIVSLICGCQREDAELQQQDQIVLGPVADAAVNRAATTPSPLPKDYRFRLYILPDGETDPAKMVATRTYTITDEGGTPTLDAGQKAIKIAQDEYDFYLVGPLMGVDDKGGAIEIASEVGVNVYAGNDIISSKTDVAVTQGVNSVTPHTLSHRMAKMQVVIERPTGASYVNLRVDEILLFDQPVTGTFTFGADGGSIAPAQETFTRKYAPPVEESDDRYVATDYIFGHAKKSVKIETTFDAEVTIDGVLQTNTYYGQSGSVATDIIVGNAYEITANPLVPTELLWRLSLVPWHDKKEGSTSSDDRELVATFSGMDAPIEINGKKYWRDRSGNDNHGELVGSVLYHSDEKYYTATQDEGSFIQLPALGEMKDMTVELVMASAYNGKTTPFRATGKDGKPAANMHVPWDEADLYLDWGEATTDRIGPIPYKLNDFGFYEGMTTWQYTRKVNAADVYSAIYQNGTFIWGENKPSRTLDFNNVRFLNGGNTVTKLYSVRIYRHVLPLVQMANNAKNDRAIYAKISTDDEGKYVQKGLILDLEGADAPSINTLVSGRTVWQDRSMFGNHAELLNGGPTYEPFKKGYTFAGSNTNKIMQLLRGLGDLSGCTIEMVMTAGVNNACDNLNFMDRTGANVYTFGAPNVKYSATFPGVAFKIGDAPSYATGLAHTWSMVRNTATRTIALYQNGYAQATSDASQQRAVTIPNQNMNLSPVTIAQIGGKLGGNVAFNGTIHAIRVYNRPLNSTERHRNYELDKEKYNIPSSSQFLPTVTDGLIFCYDGRHAPKTVAGVKYWVDEVAKNDGKIFGNVKHDAKENYYSVPQNIGAHYMQMVYPVTMGNDFTAEFVLKPDGPQNGSPIYWGPYNNGDPKGRFLYLHLPYTDNKIYVDSPGDNRYEFLWPTDVGEPTDVRKVVVRREKGALSEFFMYNKVKASSSNTSVDLSATPCTIMQFGGDRWGGRFYSIRFYGRALTNTEMQQNYDYDKAVFKFTDN